MQRNDASISAKYVTDEFFSKLRVDAVGVDSKIFGLPIVSEQAGGTYKLSDGRAEELFESVRVLFLPKASVAVLSTESVEDGGDPCVKSSRGGNRGSDVQSTGGRVRIRKTSWTGASAS